jgi:hypothetical protein
VAPPVVEAPPFTVPEPRTPPSSRRRTTPQSEPTDAGTSAGSPTAPPEAGAEPVIPPSLRRHTPPGGTSAVRPEAPADGASTPAGTTADAAGRAGEPKAPRQSRLFGRSRPAPDDAGARPRRRFRWFRNEPLDDEGGDGDANDALETLRPLGSARRRAQSFRRPRFPSFGRRRSAFPPGRELPAGPPSDDGTSSSDDGSGPT